MNFLSFDNCFSDSKGKFSNINRDYNTNSIFKVDLRLNIIIIFQIN